MASIYIAARYSAKEDMKRVAAHLENEGHTITSRWLDEKYSPSVTMDQVAGEDLVSFAVDDLADIERADVFLLFSVDPLIPTVRGGRHVETGFAIASGKTVFVVGPKENIFHHLPEVRHHYELATVVKELKEGSDG
jgi:nucleoside 2-deoxyribosyltransferase